MGRADPGVLGKTQVTFDLDTVRTQFPNSIVEIDLLLNALDDMLPRANVA